MRKKPEGQKSKPGPVQKKPSSRAGRVPAGRRHTPDDHIPGGETFARLALMSVFTVSGACGLVYEVVWTRLLVLIFGSTTQAISTVLAVFMLGLSLGSFIYGKYAPRLKDPQKTYGIVEAGIGIYTFLFLPALYLIQHAHLALFPYLYDRFVLLTVFRVVLALALMIIPTVLMGATVPLIASILAVSGRSIGRDVGTVYFLNTIGASAGSFLGAFVLIPNFGLDWTLYLGGTVNLAIGACTVLVKRVKAGKIEKDKSDTSISGGIPGYALALPAFFVIGFLSMVYENAWSRALILVFGSSIYAFATMLTAYLFGLASGSLVIGRLVDRMKDHLAWFAALSATLGLSIFVTTPLIGRMPGYFMRVFFDNAGWSHVTFIEFLACFAVMLLPTFCSGACFPLVARLFVRARNIQVGRSVADAYSMNTAGCIIGSLATGFFIIPVLGIERSLLFAGAASILLASGLLFFSRSQRQRAGYARRAALASGLVIVSLAGAAKIPNWDPKVMISGVYMYSKLMAKASGDVKDFMTRFDLLFYKEGPSDTVAVVKSPDGRRFLRINGKTDGSDGGDNYTQTLLGILPIIYSQNPRTALDIGLGTGMTAASLLDYPLDSVDCIEISTAVVRASDYFAKSNNDVLYSPKFHLHILDGRTWLMSMGRSYDLITSGPSHPWQTGDANLFTVEFFKAAKKCLNNGGLLCQWLPYYQMDTEDFRVLLKSLRSVFPFVNIWIANTDALVIASGQPLSINYVDLQSRMQIKTIRDRLRRIGIDSVEDLLSFFYIDNSALNRFTKRAASLNSDYFPLIEFSAPKYLLGAMNPDTFYELLDLSYRSKLPIANCEVLPEIEKRRITARAQYYRQWFIPQVITGEMMRKALAAGG